MKIDSNINFVYACACVKTDHLSRILITLDAAVCDKVYALAFRNFSASPENLMSMHGSLYGALPRGTSLSMMLAFH